MNRTLAAICVATLFATHGIAQEPMPISTASLQSAIERQESALRSHTVALRRDAFIVARLVSSVAELEDFQRNAAIQRALDRVDAAARKATERPAASSATMQAIEAIRDEFLEARKQGSSADLPALKRRVLNRVQPLQSQMFRSIDDLRKARQALSEAQMKLALMANDVDGSLGEALASTIEFFRAGGE